MFMSVDGEDTSSDEECPYESDTEDWLSWRKGNYITASEMPQLFGCSSYSSYNKLVHAKASGTPEQRKFDEKTESVLERGHVLERAALAIANSAHCVVNLPGVNYRYYPCKARRVKVADEWISATPDAIYKLPGNKDINSIVEVKSRWPGYDNRDYIPSMHLVQMYTQGLVFGQQNAHYITIAQYPSSNIRSLECRVTKLFMKQMDVFRSQLVTRIRRLKDDVKECQRNPMKSFRAMAKAHFLRDIPINNELSYTCHLSNFFFSYLPHDEMSTQIDLDQDVAQMGFTRPTTTDEVQQAHETNDDTPVMCKCDRQAVQRTATTQANEGRVFYCCMLGREDPNKCNFFLWQDERGKKRNAPSGWGVSAMKRQKTMKPAWEEEIENRLKAIDESIQQIKFAIGSK